MLFYIFQNIIFSILIIFIGNQIWEYLKKKYSRKITIDLVQTQVQKYKQMIEEIEKIKEIKEKTEENIDNMEQELESFIETI
jgi:conjugal transfer/entry exclusion protein